MRSQFATENLLAFLSCALTRLQSNIFTNLCSYSDSSTVLGSACSELGAACSELGLDCSELGLGWFGMVCDDCGDSGHPKGVQLSPAGDLGQPNGLHCAALD
jgi:hypothetical protein